MANNGGTMGRREGRRNKVKEQKEKAVKVNAESTEQVK